MTDENVEDLSPGDTERRFEELLEYIKADRGFDFTGYKRTTLYRRVIKRMQTVGVEDFRDYQQILVSAPEEFVELFNTILINVTSFFRDDFAWDYLREELVPRIVAGKAETDPIRLWSAGCASGQEAYSLAMLFAEQCGERRFRNLVKIYATDVDEDALAKGRQGLYASKEVRDSIPADLVEKYFDFSDGGGRFRPDLRRSVIFGRNDLVQDAPISRVDLLSCRNTLMYFNPHAQDRMLANFHFALAEGGFLFLGKSEVLVTRTHDFKPLDLKRRIFAKGPRRTRTTKPYPVVSSSAMSTSALPSDPGQLVGAGFESAPVAQVVVGLDGAIAAINQPARIMFSLSREDVGRPLKDVELSYRPLELRSRVEQVQTERRTLVVHDLRWQDNDGAARYVDVHLIPLSDNTGGFLGVNITFADVSRYNRLQQELYSSKSELETAYEELQSTNEELETTNEELHSTNEELETMNEELQSTNEELETINDELRNRTDDLNRVNDFLASILGSLKSAVVVLDRDMGITVWSERAEDFWGLRSDEVLQKHFLNLDVGFPVDKLLDPIKQCLAGTAELEPVVFPAVNRKGRSFTCRATLSPLGDRHGSSSGVIILMDSIDEEVGGEEQL